MRSSDQKESMVGAPFSKKKHPMPQSPTATESHFRRVHSSPLMKRAKKMVKSALEEKTTAAEEAFSKRATPNW